VEPSTASGCQSAAVHGLATNHCVEDREADAVCGVGERAFSRAAVRPREIRRRSGDSSHGQVVRELKTVWGPIYKS